MDGKYYIGVDLGGTNIQAGLVDGSSLAVLFREKKKTKAEAGPEAVVGRIAECINKVIEDAQLRVTDISGIGIGAPGAVDVSNGMVLNAVNLRWKNYSLVRAMKQHTTTPVVVDNDVNVGAWGEYVAGVGKRRKVNDMLAVFVGTGIGGGLVLNGDLYHGHFMTAGEIGHTVIHADGPLGRRTLENAASRTAIGNLLSELILANHKSLIQELTGDDLSRMRSKVLSQAVAEKDPLTLEVVGQSALYCGIAIANMVTMLSLPLVVIGGGVAEALGETYVGWIRKAFSQYVFPAELKSCQIELSALGDDAGIVGAAALARDRMKQT